MIYLAIQTFLLLAVTAGAFFGMGYYYYRRFVSMRDLIEVSEQPPADPPPVHHPEVISHQVSEEFEQVVTDLRTRLLEKERDIAQLLETVGQPSERDLAAERVRELETQIATQNVRISQLQDEAETMHLQLTEAQQKVDWKEAELSEVRQELENRESATSIATLNDAEVAGLRGELDIKVSELALLQSKVGTLEEQLYEREYLLQVRRGQEEKEREQLDKAVDAIWEDDLEISAVIDSEVAERINEIESKQDSVEVEFRHKIEALESTIENLRNENEMALMTAMEIAKRKETQAPVKSAPPPSAWNPPMESIREDDRVSMVELLWQSEKDAEKERLRKSVESLKKVLDQKEKAIEDLGSQVDQLSGKVDPKLQGPDDLQLIKGIGPYIRKLLEKEFGIRSFEQIAKMTDEMKEAVSVKLFFKDKIDKEDWIGQARELYVKKYGDSPDATTLRRLG